MFLTNYDPTWADIFYWSIIKNIFDLYHANIILSTWGKQRFSGVWLETWVQMWSLARPKRIQPKIQ